MTKKNYWQELWGYHELIYILSWRDIKIRYKQTVMGASWGIIRPLVTTVIFTVVFNRIAKMQNPSVAPYILMVSAGMLPWQFFASALGETSNSVIGNAGLITKVYFPRLIIPLSSIVTSLVDFAVAFIIIIVMMLWFRFLPGWQIVLLPFFIILLIASALGVGLFLTALNVKYRDFRHLIPFVIQIGLYVTPVAFSSKSIPQQWRLLYSLNPMAGIVDGFRWTLLNDSLYWPGLVISIVITVVLLFFGLRFFRKMEKNFVDDI
jgi:lipopolysaccharide transport system permease protein